VGIVKIDVDSFVRERQDEIQTLVNLSLNKAGDTIQKKVASGEISADIQDVLPLLLYEVLTINTVATLRLVSEMINDSAKPLETVYDNH
jgi:hypothetical protein